jgi:hypothetical protein
MGLTDSLDFTTKSGLQLQYGGGPSDVFVAKISNSSGPVISGAEVSEKKLIVTGDGFADGARVLLNAESQKTRNDELNLSSRLICKKSGKRISRGQTVPSQTRNPDRSLSHEFTYTRP